ncbi:MAG: hypothetical protein ABH873_01930 [Candidatus Firestonebacteria bacterium]
MLENIIGHEVPKKIISNIIQHSKISHAYLFLGKEGIGKKKFAIEFAKIINCENLDLNNISSCEKCVSCVNINLGKHPDVTIIEPEKNIIRIDEIREIRKRIFLKPYCKVKVCIVNDAEKMNPQSSDAFLKTLEEPVGDVVFLLIVSNLYSVFPTIRSRCQIMKFTDLKENEILTYLKSKFNISHDSLIYLVNLSEGSMGKVISYIERDILKSREKIFDFFDNPESKKKLFDMKIFKEGIDIHFEDLLDVFVSIYKDILLYKFNKPVINFDKTDKIISYSPRFSIDNLTEILSKLNNIRVLLKINLNQELSLNSLFIAGGIG